MVCLKMFSYPLYAQCIKIRLMNIYFITIEFPSLDYERMISCPRGLKERS